MLFDVGWLCDVLGSATQSNNEETITRVTTNSREKNVQSLFVPLVGDRFDGHDYVEEAIANGAVAVLWDKTRDIPSSIPEEISVFLVDDTLKALQHLASAYREKINPVVIGITGSNGKTSTKDMLSAILKERYETHSTLGNLNNHIGVPLTILSMPINTEILIVEMGMSNAGEIDLLTSIARPNHVIITNIGESHIENLGSRHGIALEKLAITNGLKPKGTAIVDGDEPLVEELEQGSFKRITCGFGKNAQHRIESVVLTKTGTEFNLDGIHYSIPLHGKHHAKNAAYCIALAKCLKLNEVEIQCGLNKTALTNMRFEWLQGKNGVTLINDAYNASPTSMIGAIEVIKDFTDYDRKIVVLGDIFELGDFARTMHESIAEHITSPIDYAFTIGNHSKFITNRLNEQTSNIKTKHFDQKEQFLKEILTFCDENTIILFKASRGMAFEEIIASLTE